MCAPLRLTKIQVGESRLTRSERVEGERDRRNDKKSRKKKESDSRKIKTKTKNEVNRSEQKRMDGVQGKIVKATFAHALCEEEGLIFGSRIVWVAGWAECLLSAEAGGSYKDTLERKWMLGYRLGSKLC